MGSYLSKPVTEKISSDESNDKLNCGASSMQGWRVNQEDAHNCILDFDHNVSYFAVYDGHGGHEVAHYCSDKLPQFIKDTEAYKNGDVEKSLIDGFLGFDATITTPEIITILKEIAGDKEAEEESDEEENVNNLYEEATMPIEQVIEKYTNNLVNPAIRNLKKEGDKFPKSPCLKSKRESENDVGSSAASSSEAGSSTAPAESCNDGVSSSSIEESEAKCAKKEEPADSEVKPKAEKNGSVIPEIKISPDSSDSKDITSSEADVKNETDTPTQNGDASPEAEDVSSSSPSQENGDVSKKGKGKALAKSKGVKTPKKSDRPKRNAQQLYKHILDFQDESDDTEDEEDKTFHCPGGSDSSEDDDVNTAIPVKASDDSSEDGEEEEEEEDEDDDIDDGEDYEFARNMKEEPGSDSGCTAVVALIKGNELFVANAGDSRCIVCRSGKAVEMSFDHKPEDEPERERVVKAGGQVTFDGRVNGGLNLSRAIGDHAYKQNKKLSDREQMITALPDIKTLTIKPNEDEFMVLACDGIWNFMSSQEVVDFVRPRIAEKQDKLSQICEEMFDHCLAPNTLGDGTGCDNMTAIIVQFKSNILKRSASPEPAVSESKKAKTDENESQIDTTA